MEKKKVAFIITGQIRENQLGYHVNPFQDILSSHSKYIFSQEFKDNYDYDVYIVVDNIDEAKCNDFFGKHLKGVICLDKQHHYIPSIQFSTCNSGCYNASVSFFRAKLAWKMVEDSGIKYEYVFKMRPDVVLFNDTFPSFKALDMIPNRQIYFVWDICAVGRYDIMKFYCNMFDNLGVTVKSNFVFENNGLMSYTTYYSNDWKYLAIIETQVCEILMKYVVDKGLSIDEALKDSRIDFTLGRRDFTHHKNNKFPLDYYDTHPDYKRSIL